MRDRSSSKISRSSSFATPRRKAESAEMEALGVGAGYIFAVVGTNGLLIEPVFFWPDAIEELHRRSVEASHLARLKVFAANPPARKDS